MKKRFFVSLLAMLLFLGLSPAVARADCAPKPSVVVDFTGLENETYFATLLSDKESNGPWSVEHPYQDEEADQTAREKFCSYSDPDGFSFLGYFTDCSETDRLRWGYQPPENFKILIYFPKTDTIAVSAEIYQQYAFDSYYKVSAADLNLSAGVVQIPALVVGQSYDYTTEAVSMLCRILITLAIELAIALLFAFRTKRQLLVILITNLATQLLLNVALNLIHYQYGALEFLLNYIWLELLVILVEAVVYRRLLPRREEITGKKRFPCLYAVTANAVSFFAGLLLGRFVPEIF